MWCLNVTVDPFFKNFLFYEYRFLSNNQIEEIFLKEFIKNLLIFYIAGKKNPESFHHEVLVSSPSYLVLAYLMIDGV